MAGLDIEIDNLTTRPCMISLGVGSIIGQVQSDPRSARSAILQIAVLRADLEYR